jgi:DNA-directed RNA polymerase II subunit RPB7
MFFHISLHRIIQLPPKYFGPNLRNTLIEKLHSEVEGTCSGRYGFIVTVTAVEEIGMGKIQHASGAAQFPVSFKAIVFRPFKGEVLDAVVSSVNKMGFMAEVGPLQIFISKYVSSDSSSLSEVSCRAIQ